MKNSAAPPEPSFSWLPDEIVANCLARISKCQYPSLSSVSKTFYSILSSPKIYTARSKIGATEPRLYFCLRVVDCINHNRWFTLRTPDETLINNNGIKKVNGLSLVPVNLPSSSSSSYVFSRFGAAIVTVGSKIYQIGGSERDVYKRTRVIRVLDCRSNKRRFPPNMKVARKDAKACFLDGKIYVMGGCRKREEPMNWCEVFDVKTQTWKEKPLPSPSGDVLARNQVFVYEARLYVITKSNKYVYDPKEGTWVQEIGFVGLEHRIRPKSSRWCVIDNLVISDLCKTLWWYDLKTGMASMVQGLENMYVNRHYRYYTREIVKYGGKVVIVWQEISNLFVHRFWFAVIRLEKRLTSSGLDVWAEIVRFNSILPGRFNFMSCHSVEL